MRYFIQVGREQGFKGTAIMCYSKCRVRRTAGCLNKLYGSTYPRECLVHHEMNIARVLGVEVSLQSYMNANRLGNLISRENCRRDVTSDTRKTVGHIIA